MAGYTRGAGKLVFKRKSAVSHDQAREFTPTQEGYERWSIFSLSLEQHIRNVGEKWGIESNRGPRIYIIVNDACHVG